MLRRTPKALIDRQVVLEIKALLSYSELPIGRIAERLCSRTRPTCAAISGGTPANR